MKTTLFIDESGKSSLSDYNNTTFILTGVILDNNELQTTEGFFNYIKLKYNLPPEMPFHSYEIFEHPAKKLKNSDLMGLSKTISEFLSLIPVKIYIAEVNKEDFRSVLGIRNPEDLKGSSEKKEMKDFPYRVAASYIFARFGEYLKNKDSMGQIIADSRKGGDHQLLKTLDLCKEKAVPIKDIYHKAIRERVSAICFAEKNFLSGGLEITDLISYVKFNHSIKNISSFSDRGIDRIWNRIREIAKIGKIDKPPIRRFFKLKKDEVHKHLR